MRVIQMSQKSTAKDFPITPPPPPPQAAGVGVQKYPETPPGPVLVPSYATPSPPAATPGGPRQG